MKDRGRAAYALPAAFADDTPSSPPATFRCRNRLCSPRRAADADADYDPLAQAQALDAGTLSRVTSGAASALRYASRSTTAAFSEAQEILEAQVVGGSAPRRPRTDPLAGRASRSLNANLAYA